MRQDQIKAKDRSTEPIYNVALKLTIVMYIVRHLTLPILKVG